LSAFTVADLNVVKLLLVDKLLYRLRNDAFINLATVRLVLQSTQ